MSVLHSILLTTTIMSIGLSFARAGAVIGDTRVVLDSNRKEAPVNINNPDNIPYLIQSQIETPSGGAGKVLFIIAPPLYRSNNGQQNVERIVAIGALPQDKGSLFWLNIKAIPSASQVNNALQIAIKTRIKLIYQLTRVKGASPEEQAGKLRWQRIGSRIQINSPTRHVMNFNETSLAGKRVPDASYVLPGSTATFDLPSGVMGGPVTFRITNDYDSPGVGHKANLQVGEEILNGIYGDGSGLCKSTISTVGTVDNHRAPQCYIKWLQSRFFQPRVG